VESNDRPLRTGPPEPDDVSIAGTQRPVTAARTGRRADGPKRPKSRSRLASSFRIVLGIVLILGGFAGIAAMRLSRGPISLGFVKPQLESIISSELGPNEFHMRDAQLVWGDGGLEVVVVDLRITEPNGSLLMQAPRAVVGLSGAAALRGRLGLRRISLINPRLQAFYADDGTLSVRFAQAADVAQTSGSDAVASQSVPPSSSTQPGTDTSGPIDFVKAITNISAQARRREHATAFLHEIGLQQATLIIDNGRRKTIWKVPDVRIDLSHKTRRSLISGRAVIDSLTGPWS
jgi:hypothetical protein